MELKERMLERNKVVVVDDEQNIVEVVCDILEDEDIKAVSCVYGTRALGCIYEEQPSLVVLDVQMPGMNGIESFRHMHAHPQTASTPVIFLTANSHIVSHDIPNYKGQNVELLPKPFSIVTFLDLVHTFLDHC